MRFTHKYRVFPTPAQRTALERTLDNCRWVYNQVLEVRKDAWQEREESVSRYETIKMLPAWKSDRPWLKQTHSQVLQEVCKRVDLAFKHFFRRVKAGAEPGYPRFKGKGWYKSFTFPQSGFKLTGEGLTRRRATLSLSKIGDIRIHLHRPIEGEIKTLTVKRDRLGNWYACFSCEVECEPLPPLATEVGVDLGLLSFAAYSDGREPTPNPRFFRRDERDLKRAQRKLSACQKGATEWRERKRVVQKIHKRIRNRRENFAHQLSRELVDSYQLIVLEDLGVSEMLVGNHTGLNKSVSDAAWRKLIEYVSYKAERAGRTCVLVDPRGTSQMCSGCGEIVPKDLSVRTHDCPHCGLVVDRDVNAARNILARGRAASGKRVLQESPAHENERVRQDILYPTEPPARGLTSGAPVTVPGSSLF